MTENWPGTAYPLGATFDGSGTNFALFSEVAERVELPFFPAILNTGAAEFSLDATHTVPIGQYVESATDDDEEERR